MDDKQHKYDIFEEGDEVPYFNGLATVIAREVIDDPALLPDEVTTDIGDFAPPNNEPGASPVLVTLEKPSDGEEVAWAATRLARDLKESFDEHGLPTVRAEGTAGIGGDDRIRVQTPATGSNPLDRDEARLLAGLLRSLSDFEPLYALLGDVDSPGDMDALADALERAALVRDLGDRLDAE